MKRPNIEGIEVDARTDDFDWDYENGGMDPEVVLELIAYIRHLETKVGLKRSNSGVTRFFGGDSDGLISDLPWRWYAKPAKDAYRRERFATVTKGPDEPPVDGDFAECMVPCSYDRRTRTYMSDAAVISEVERTLTVVALLASLPMTVSQ